ncbi:LCP family protein [Streptomyces olivaceiscleroticus]|uniref:LCP family glycopolymer transferase n=1 Tax=Streptomyces olivaceiscleroticus TaxID=68245 RepID=UPI0031F7AC9B
MNDRLGGWPDENQYVGTAETAHVSTGQIWLQAEYAPESHPNPHHIVGGGDVGAGIRPGGHAPLAPGAASAPMVPGAARAPRGRPAPAHPGRRRRLARTTVFLAGMLLLTACGTYIWADTRLSREVDLDRIADRPTKGRGTNYLIVGSDSRSGLTDRAKQELHTGGSADAGRRTDSMILLHTGAHGTTMMSLPRDSWVTIPPYIRPDTGKHYRASKNKLNAAFSFGGPDLLVRTIEHNTGLRIDHYTEIGFAGFVGIVDAVGGVRMCVDRNIKDEKSGLDLKAGCHTLDGRKALAFVRQRHQEARGDLGRSRNQQKFLSALADKTATPDTFLDPSKVYPTMRAGLDTLIVDKDTDLRTLSALFEAMKGVTAGNGKRLNVPVSSLGFHTSKGSAVQWNLPQARKLFGELRDDRPVTVGNGG